MGTATLYGGYREQYRDCYRYPFHHLRYPGAEDNHADTNQTCVHHTGNRSHDHAVSLYNSTPDDAVRSNHNTGHDSPTGPALTILYPSGRHT